MIERSRITGRLFLFVSLAAILVVSGSCKKKSESTASGGSSETTAGGTGSARVTYRPEVRVMEEKEGKSAIIGVSTSGASLLFDSNNTAAQGFKAGDVLVVKNM